MAPICRLCYAKYAVAFASVVDIYMMNEREREMMGIVTDMM